MSLADNRKLNFKSDRPNERLDTFLVRKLDESSAFKGTLSRAQIQKLISDNRVLVDGVPRKKNFTLKSGERIEIEIPAPSITTLAAEIIDFDIIYEDNDVVIVNKPAGIITHPTALRATGTLINGLIGKNITLAPAGGIFRPGIVHRLDKETSGTIILAKTDRAYHELLRIFKERRIEKYYSALVIGNLPQLKGTFEKNIGRHPKSRAKMAVMDNGGREAKTSFEISDRFVGFDLLNLRIYTGRTHQIRVHLANSGHPVLADSIYGGRKIEQHVRSLGRIGASSESIARLLETINDLFSNYPGMCLHARRIIFNHPTTGIKLDFSAPLPEAYNNLVDVLREVSEKTSAN